MGVGLFPFTCKGRFDDCSRPCCHHAGFAKHGYLACFSGSCGLVTAYELLSVLTLPLSSGTLVGPVEQNSICQQVPQVHIL